MSEPKKVKAYIGELKAHLDKLSTYNNNNDTALLPSKYLQLLLLSELCQRGTLIPLKDVFIGSGNGDNANDNDGGNGDGGCTKILDAIQNSAGKAMLDETKVPKPLVAGSAVISSMVAEKLADILLSIAASKAAETSTSTSSINNNFLETMGIIPENEKSQDVLRRCQDVTDKRFEILLNLGRASFLKERCCCSNGPSGNTSNSNSNSNSTQSKIKIEGYAVVAVLLLRMSLGNLFRAASFSNPDQPPMWKKSLDLCVKLNGLLLSLRHLLNNSNAESNGQTVNNENTTCATTEDAYEAYHIRDTIHPLQNLIRIAESKNNLKRVSELSLRLTESYICSQENEIQNVIMNEMSQNIWTEINTEYVDDYVPKDVVKVDSSKPNSRFDSILQGRKSLKSFNGSLVDSLKLKLLYRILSVRVELEVEKWVVDSISKSRYETISNRSGIITSTAAAATNTSALGSISSAPTKESIQLDVRRDVLTNSLEDSEKVQDFDGDELSKSAQILQNELLSVESQMYAETIQSDMQNAINDILKIQIDRLLLKAQALSINCCHSKESKKRISASITENTLDDIENFVNPLLDAHVESIDTENKPLTMIHLLKVACQAILIVTYLRQNSQSLPDRIDNATQSLIIIQNKLNEIEQKEQSRKEHNGKDNTVKTSTDCKENLEKTELDRSCWAGRCHLYLRSKDVYSIGRTKNCQLITKEAIKTIKVRKLPLTHTQYGTPFLMCLVSWSGLYKTPWSFCNISTARAIIRYARGSLKVCESEWGRKLTQLESILLNLAEADAECGYLNGGFNDKAKSLYESVLSLVQSVDDKCIASLIRSHCVAGLIMIALSEENIDSVSIQIKYNETVRNAKESMSELKSIQESNVLTTMLQMAMISCVSESSFNFHLCHLRTLVAESLIRSSKLTEAQDFLNQAVIDAPSNYDAAFALGAFWLRMSFFNDDITNDCENYSKRAQIQLLKSLKLDSTKADPFSLLGVWYENKRDNKRAVGCFTKALLIDPSHPVAGRGLLRSSNGNAVIDVCTKAVNISSNTSGWAWRALADAKALSNGADEEAILLYQEALRCHDIDTSRQHSLSLFFLPPFDVIDNMEECSETWAALACSYRRLGKYSASLRAYEYASLSDTKNKFLCSWAQVQLDLGLLEDAASKFEVVLVNQRYPDSLLSASFGLASCKLLSAAQNVDEGKYGAALKELMGGIQVLQTYASDETSGNFICVLKLLGDLYSNGFKIPHSTFVGSDQITSSKCHFIKQGGDMYLKLLKKVETRSDQSANKQLVTAALSDIGSNFLLQAFSENAALIDHPNCSAVISLLENAKEYFVRAIESNELDPYSWLGFGCSVLSLDPVLSQHAFGRALQLDRHMTDAWVNLSFAYCEKDNLIASEKVTDALAQVGETPLMWIVRGLLLEKRAIRGDVTKRCNYESASDAYRACLQTSRNPVALLRLALTCRKMNTQVKSRLGDNETPIKENLRKESEANLSMFMDFSRDEDPTLELIQHLTMIEKHEIIDECKVDNSGVRKVLDSLGLMDTENGGIAIVEEDIESIVEAQREVLQNPESGLCWLRFSKLVTLSFTKAETSSADCQQMVIDTVQRARHLLKASVAEPRTLNFVSTASHSYTNIVSNEVSAKHLADSFALSSWVGGHDPLISSHDHQRALLLDPENCFARAQMVDN